ncbi:uncharacterized protein LOC119084397 [Bradysia coprophila]|uniref:uncharacterized protein LOC119084397 n=1 Tax=Bradysia coprophila TaxID=38358 RepID=UPI00187DA6EE|nr:uncharacterized protein LOC119084397 [Bradysia coprophila]
MFPNEEYRDQWNDINLSRCQRTCADYLSTDPCMSYTNEPDCYCKPGFARRTDREYGECIPISSIECQSQFPVNEADCALLLNEELVINEPWPHQMDKTCKNHKVVFQGEAPGGNFWAPHCECKSGYKRLPNGVCVAIDDPECYRLWKPSYGQCLLRGENFRWGLTCQPTCANHAQPLTCNSQQSVSDCYCSGNKVRIFNNESPCVSVEECDIYLNPPD